MLNLAEALFRVVASHVTSLGAASDRDRLKVVHSRLQQGTVYLLPWNCRNLYADVLRNCHTWSQQLHAEALRVVVTLEAIKRWLWWAGVRTDGSETRLKCPMQIIAERGPCLRAT